MRATIIVLLLTLVFAACSAEIGDGCASSVDCSPDGDRICDRAQRGGYCTIKGCQADKCPDGALCVRFGSEPRFERTYCMAACESSGDCRDGYACVADNPNGATVIDQNRHGSYCVQAASE